jgi:hemolysin-activating ACP:hemolysin acyltransferase
VVEETADATPEVSPQQIGAMMSKLVSASIGDIALVFSRSPAHKHYTYADLEWMILPAVFSEQYYVAEFQHKDIGARAPVAAVLWASVSDETDRRLAADPGQKIRLRPDEWKSGEHLWIVDVAGDPRVIVHTLQTLAGTRFKNALVKLAAHDGVGGARVETLQNMLATINEERGAA